MRKAGPCIPRTASGEDAAEIARLCSQLGYPASADDMAARLQRVLSAADAQVFVVARGERLMGWIEVASRTSLETGCKAEILGLVVDVDARRSGIGRVLVEAAETWARRQGLHRLTVRSNAARLESHPFYEGIGFARDKTQHVYIRRLR